MTYEVVQLLFKVRLGGPVPQEIKTSMHSLFIMLRVWLFVSIKFRIMIQNIQLYKRLNTTIWPYT